MGDPTTQANFRFPVELIEWLDHYAEYLSKSSGYSVSRTQALIRLISLSRPSEQVKMDCYEQAKLMNMTLEEYEAFTTGLAAWCIKTRNQISEQEYVNFAFHAGQDKDSRELCIRLGREEKQKSEMQKFRELMEIINIKPEGP